MIVDALKTAESGTPVLAEFRMLIDGKLVGGARTLDVIDPATGEHFATCPCADLDQLNAAVGAAKRAFPAWTQVPIEDRRARLLAIADDLEMRVDELAPLLTHEQGKPLADAIREVSRSAQIIRILGGMTPPEQILEETDAGIVIRHYSALGVVATITPWNVPLALLVTKVIPALLTGNTVVSKPAATTPLTTLRFGEIAAAHLPAGVLNIIVDDNDLGAALSGHPDVAKISFTGSTGTGKKVMEAGVSTLKRLTLELGGNDPAIVLADVDVHAVAPKLLAAAMMNAGQICLAIKRLYVHASIYDEMCAELARLADALVVGNGLDEGVQIGPVQNQAQFAKLSALLEETRGEAVVLTKAAAPAGPGYFVRPTVVRDIADDSRLVRDEQFGPILPVLRFTDIDDALTRANSTPFGLGGSVWTKDWKRGLEISQRINAGMLWVNQHMVLDPHYSNSAAKESGLGREFGPEGVLEFTQAHITYVAK
jgi:acyl-CoA reductase-like NAD-dependent aldehyde dehydrogenase